MTSDVELLEILRDIAAGRRNSVGDYWSRDYCNQAAAEIEALRAEVEMLRDAFSDEDMTAGAHWFGRYVEQKRRAERLAEVRRIARHMKKRALDGATRSALLYSDDMRDYADQLMALAAQQGGDS